MGAIVIPDFRKLCFNVFMGSNFNRRQDDLESTDSQIGAKVDLNNLMKKVKDEEKKSKRQNFVISAAALSAVAAFGIILTL